MGVFLFYDRMKEENSGKNYLAYLQSFYPDKEKAPAEYRNLMLLLMAHFTNTGILEEAKNPLTQDQLDIIRQQTSETLEGVDNYLNLENPDPKMHSALPVLKTLRNCLQKDANNLSAIKLKNGRSFKSHMAESRFGQLENVSFEYIYSQRLNKSLQTLASLESAAYYNSSEFKGMMAALRSVAERGQGFASPNTLNPALNRLEEATRNYISLKSTSPYTKAGRDRLDAARELLDEVQDLQLGYATYEKLLKNDPKRKDADLSYAFRSNRNAQPKEDELTVAALGNTLNKAQLAANRTFFKGLMGGSNFTEKDALAFAHIMIISELKENLNENNLEETNEASKPKNIYEKKMQEKDAALKFLSYKFGSISSSSQIAASISGGPATQNLFKEYKTYKETVYKKYIEAQDPKETFLQALEQQEQSAARTLLTANSMNNGKRIQQEYFAKLMTIEAFRQEFLAKENYSPEELSAMKNRLNNIESEIPGFRDSSDLIYNKYLTGYDSNSRRNDMVRDLKNVNQYHKELLEVRENLSMKAGITAKREAVQRKLEESLPQANGLISENEGLMDDLSEYLVLLSVEGCIRADGNPQAQRNLCGDSALKANKDALKENVKEFIQERNYNRDLLLSKIKNSGPENLAMDFHNYKKEKEQLQSKGSGEIKL
ncbi:MAG: hypothetical protein Q4B50_08310, partial [Bacillota bacterium]|nr:hypothetical protein [Bacillota bacterium]